MQCMHVCMYVCIIIDIYVIYVLREIYVQKSHSLPAHPSRHSRWSTAQCPHSPQSNAPCRGCRRGKEGCACRCTASAGSRPGWLRTSCRQCVWSSLGRCWCPRHPIRLRMCSQVAAENVGNKKLKRASECFRTMTNSSGDGLMSASWWQPAPSK